MKEDAPGMSKPGAGAETTDCLEGKTAPTSSPASGGRNEDAPSVFETRRSLSLNQSIYQTIQDAHGERRTKGWRRRGRTGNMGIRPPYLLGANQETEEAINDVRCRI